MDNLQIYVYECTHCHEETHLSSESVAPPEAHLNQTEIVYCGNCDEDREMIFHGCEGIKPGTYVETPEGRRYCPLCEGACKTETQ